jgi:DNA-binding response OmpR family regulator
MRRRAVRVLVIDSERAAASELAGMLMRAGFAAEVGECAAGTSIDGVATDFDIVALGPSGLVGERAALCGALREGGYDGAIVAVCADISDGGILVEQGVDDFLIAPVEEREMAARLRFCCSRRRAPRPLLRWGPLELDRLGRTVRLRERTIRLTSRDCELLACLIEAGGGVVTRARMLEQVWQGREDRGTNVVEVHLSRLRDKLGEDAWLIQTVRRAGYRLCSRR